MPDRVFINWCRFYKLLLSRFANLPFQKSKTISHSTIALPGISQRTLPRQSRSLGWIVLAVFFCLLNTYGIYKIPFFLLAGGVFKHGEDQLLGLAGVFLKKSEKQCNKARKTTSSTIKNLNKNMLC